MWIINFLYRLIYKRIIKKYNYSYLKYDPYYNPEYIDTNIGD